MAEMLVLRCTSCAAEYAVPDSFLPHLEGRALYCPACERWWAPLKASSGPPIRLVDGRPERAKIDLRRFRRGSTSAAAPAPASPAPPAPASPAPPAPAAPVAPASPEAARTVRVPVQAAGTPALRVVVSGPGTDLKGVFDLGSKDFLIGQRGCHLNLPQASIPGRAIRIHADQAAERGFLFEGLDGFPIPIGGLSVLSGRIEPGGTVHLELGPYRVDLETSGTPGSPIADLGGSAPAASAPAASAPAASAPAASAPAPSAPAPGEPAPAPAAPAPDAAPASPPARPEPPRIDLPKPRPTLQGGQDVDIRAQVQELAVDVRPDQPNFSDRQDELEIDLDQTVTDLGARGYQASQFGSGLAGLEVSLVRADGPSQGKRFRVTKSPLLIGRSEGDLVIADRRVSSKHAQLDVSGPRVYTLKDLASTNGTTVNDRPISIGHLQDGDRISFGGVLFDFHAQVVKAR